MYFSFGRARDVRALFLSLSRDSVTDINARKVAVPTDIGGSEREKFSRT